MKCITPRSDHQKIALLRQILSELTAPNSQVPQIPESLTQSLAFSYDAYQQQHQQLLEAREAWRHQGAKRVQQRRELEMTLRDIYQQVKRKRRRQRIPAHIFEAFGLSESGTQKPETRAMKAPIEQAKSVLAAAQIAAAKGFSLLSDPSQADLAAALQTYQQTRARLTETRNQERQSLDNIRNLRAEVHDQLIKLKLAVKLGSVGQSMGQERAHFEALGFSYKSTEPKPEPTINPNKSNEHHATHHPANNPNAHNATHHPATKSNAHNATHDPAIKSNAHNATHHPAIKSNAHNATRDPATKSNAHNATHHPAIKSNVHNATHDPAIKSNAHNATHHPAIKSNVHNATHVHHTLNAAGHLVRSLKASHALAQDSHPGIPEQQPRPRKGRPRKGQVRASPRTTTTPT